MKRPAPKSKFLPPSSKTRRPPRNSNSFQKNQPVHYPLDEERLYPADGGPRPENVLSS